MHNIDQPRIDIPQADQHGRHGREINDQCGQHDLRPVAVEHQDQHGTDHDRRHGKQRDIDAAKHRLKRGETAKQQRRRDGESDADKKSERRRASRRRDMQRIKIGIVPKLGRDSRRRGNYVVTPRRPAAEQLPPQQEGRHAQQRAKALLHDQRSPEFERCSQPIANRVKLGHGKQIMRARTRKMHVDDVGDAPRRRMHHHHLIGEEHRLVDAVGHHQGRGLARRPDALQLQIHASTQNLVEGAERFVQQENRGFGDQRTGNGHALAHAAGQLSRQRFGVSGQSNQLDQIADPSLVRAYRLAQHLERQRDVATNAAPRQQRRILKHDPEFAAGAKCFRLLVAHQDDALIRRLQAGDYSQQGRFAAA